MGVEQFHQSRLDDIGKLEEYIQQSNSVLIFLSRGYFLSRNCLREAQRTVDMKKPLILIREADPKKGGQSLKATQEECPESLRQQIFFSGVPIANWHRLRDFQLATLKFIAEQVSSARIPHV